MNSRYIRPAPQMARMPQMEMNVPQMQVAPPPQITESGPNPIVGGLTQLGTAFMNRKQDPEAPQVNVQADQTAPVVPEPGIPIAPVPQYGARPESPMLKKKPTILDALMGGTGV